MEVLTNSIVEWWCSHNRFLNQLHDLCLQHKGCRLRVQDRLRAKLSFLGLWFFYKVWSVFIMCSVWVVYKLRLVPLIQWNINHRTALLRAKENEIYSSPLSAGRLSESVWENFLYESKTERNPPIIFYHHKWSMSGN